MTRLVTVAHGTRSGEGNAVALELTRLAGAALGVTSVTSYVELQEPLLADALKQSAEPTVVVPLLLSRGYHTRVDLPEALAAAPGPAGLTVALGPSAALVEAQVARLVEAGGTPGQPLVLAAAGSNDPIAAEDLRAAADLLAQVWGSECRIASMAAGDIADVVRPGDAVSTYLLAPGHFAREITAISRTAGATVIADVVGPHPAVVDLICSRFREGSPA
jgi:sirohydrochlorin ferrochelatase